MNDLIFGWKGQIKDPVLARTIVNAICDKADSRTCHIACIRKDNENGMMIMKRDGFDQHWFFNVINSYNGNSECAAGIVTVEHQILSTQSEILATNKGDNCIPYDFNLAIEYLESKAKEINGEICLLDEQKVYLYSETDDFIVCRTIDHVAIWCNHPDIIDKVEYRHIIFCEPVSGLYVL